MKQINHFNIVRIHEVIDDDESDKIYIGKEINQISYGILLIWTFIRMG